MNRFYLFSFSDSKDVDLARIGSPWQTAKQYLAITLWIPHFDPRFAYIGSSPVWVQLLALLIEYWHGEALRHITSPLGTYLPMDLITRSQGRKGKHALFARVLVDVCSSSYTNYP